jgi:hypothetical protein
MVIADVPTPIALPFAYFPMTQENISESFYPAIMIQITDFSLQNGGIILL